MQNSIGREERIAGPGDVPNIWTNGCIEANGSILHAHVIIIEVTREYIEGYLGTELDLEYLL